MGSILSGLSSEAHILLLATRLGDASGVAEVSSVSSEALMICSSRAHIKALISEIDLSLGRYCLQLCLTCSSKTTVTLFLVDNGKAASSASEIHFYCRP